MFSTIYDAILDEFAQKDLSKGNKTKLKIIEGFIQANIESANSNVTFNSIAKASGVSRPLIVHYFKTKEEIFNLAVKFVRANLQMYVTERMKDKSDSKELLKAYFYAVFSWQVNHHTQSLFWLQFYNRCSLDKDNLLLNSQLTEAGRLRIQKIIELGIVQERFECQNPSLAAKTIQTIITGGCLILQTENIAFERNIYIDDLFESILILLGS